MTTIYLIRHAESEGNLYRIAHGHGNSDLTQRGWRQVRALEQRFSGIHIDAVYASDLYRTCATASAIYKPKGLPLHRMSALREIYLGDWEHQSWGFADRHWPEEMQKFLFDPALWRLEGAELPQDARKRVMEAIQRIAAVHDGETVAVFSHGYVIRLLLAEIQGIVAQDVGKTPTGENTAVSLLKVEGDNLRVVFRDDSSHLTAPDLPEGTLIRKRPSGLWLWFQPLRLPEQAEQFCGLVSDSWQDPRPFRQEKLLADAAELDTLVGYLREEPVGVIQMAPAMGQIVLTCIRPEWQKQGFGLQLIGQATEKARTQGAQHLSVALPENSVVQHFFAACGFVAAGGSGDGQTVLEKDLRFDPEFAGGT